MPFNWTLLDRKDAGKVTTPAERHPNPDGSEWVLIETTRPPSVPIHPIETHGPYATKAEADKHRPWENP